MAPVPDPIKVPDEVLNQDPDVHVDDSEIRAQLEKELEEDLAVTWKEVGHACCTHTPREWGIISLHMVGIAGALYFFLFSLDLMGTAAKIMGGCTAGTLLGDINNPIAGLTIGILATVLLQSSSTTTSIIVSLVGSDTIEVKLAIYIIMGANIGTSVTNTIVAMGQMGDKDQLERAFAAATVHDAFNILAVVVLLPIEAATNYLYHLTKAITPDEVGDKSDKWEGPLKKIVGPLVKRMINANKGVIKDIANEEPGRSSCSDFYPVVCTNSTGGLTGAKSTYQDCVLNSNSSVGLITCDEDYGCPAFFQDGADQGTDQTSGWVCFFLSLFFLVLCLIFLIKVLSSLLLGASQRVLRKATDLNGYVAMLVGCGITVLVQSSSITTSVLTPLAGLDIITLEVMFPITLGANIGTTVTGLLASLVSGSVNALQVALAHLFFNISGIIIWYPIPWMRQWPLRIARFLGHATRRNRYFPIFYIVFTFFIMPLALLGISILFDLGVNDPSPGLLTLGIVILIVIIATGAYFWWACTRGDLKQRYYDWGTKRARRKLAVNNLADDMELLKYKIGVLSGDIHPEEFIEVKKIDAPSPVRDPEAV